MRGNSGLTRYFLGVAAAALVALALGFAVPHAAYAADQELVVDTNTPNSTVFVEKNMITDLGKNYPNEEFAFTLEPVTVAAGTTTAGSPAAGVGGYVSSGVAITKGTASIAYTTADAGGNGALPAAADCPTGIDQADKANYRTSTKQVGISLAGATFTKPGIYRYRVTETLGSTLGMTYDKRSYLVDVYVGYEGIANPNDPTAGIDPSPSGDAGPMEILGFTVWTEKNYEGAAIATGEVGKKPGFESTLDFKVGGAQHGVPFSNYQSASDLSLSKKVTGSLGDRVKEFAFTVAGTASKSTTYDVKYIGADGQPIVGKTPATITTTDAGAFTTNVTLKSGERMVIVGLPTGASYTLTESDYAAEGYATKSGTDKYAGSTYPISYTYSTDGVTATGTLAVDGTDNTKKNTAVEFNNDKNTITPTGLFLTYWPFVLAALVAAVGVVAFVAMRRRSSSDTYQW